MRNETLLYSTQEDEHEAGVCTERRSNVGLGNNSPSNQFSVLRPLRGRVFIVLFRIQGNLTKHYEMTASNDFQ